MPMPRAMLVPTDLTTAARHAAQRAAMLARENGASIELLHVIETGALTQLTRLLADPDSMVVSRIVAQATGPGFVRCAGRLALRRRADTPHFQRRNLCRMRATANRSTNSAQRRATCTAPSSR